MTFDEAFDTLIGHEGGYVNHPNDPGGATRWGVTERVARAHGYTGPMRDFPRDQAKAIYRKSYWEPVKADQLPKHIRFDVFDGAVNSDVERSIKWLQQAVGTSSDGDIGPKTLAAVAAENPERISKRYNGHRLAFMTNLTTWPSFGKGWARRIAANLLL